MRWTYSRRKPFSAGLVTSPFRGAGPVDSASVTAAAARIHGGGPPLVVLPPAMSRLAWSRSSRIPGCDSQWIVSCRDSRSSADISTADGCPCRVIWMIRGSASALCHSGRGHKAPGVSNARNGGGEAGVSDRVPRSPSPSCGMRYVSGMAVRLPALQRKRMHGWP
jgi:hypothetical protein